MIVLKNKSNSDADMGSDLQDTKTEANTKEKTHYNTYPKFFVCKIIGVICAVVALIASILPAFIITVDTPVGNMGGFTTNSMFIDMLYFDSIDLITIMNMLVYASILYMIVDAIILLLSPSIRESLYGKIGVILQCVLSFAAVAVLCMDIVMMFGFFIIPSYGIVIMIIALLVSAVVGVLLVKANILIENEANKDDKKGALVSIGHRIVSAVLSLVAFVLLAAPFAHITIMFVETDINLLQCLTFEDFSILNLFVWLLYFSIIYNIVEDVLI